VSGDFGRGDSIDLTVGAGVGDCCYWGWCWWRCWARVVGWMLVAAIGGLQLVVTGVRELLEVRLGLVLC